MQLINSINKLLLFLNILAVQPSSSVNFNFRLFDKYGKAIEPNEICSKYIFTKSNLPEQYNFCNTPYSLQCDQHSKKISLNTVTVYSDVEFYFIHKTDTMAVRIINSGYGAIVSIDSLVFKHGEYAIQCNSRIVDGKTLPNLPVLNLKEIDYEQAMTKYYNFWLGEYKKVMKVESSEEYASTKRFRKLQRIYHIPKDDMSYKTAQQLHAK
jgi:hypothetical protein